MIFPSVLQRQIHEHPFPLLFATISGAHLYGFPSPDSDFDLRGTHILPLAEVLSLEAGQETIEQTTRREEFEIDLVTHDLKKFFNLMLKRNGYVLEQLLSPLVVHTTPEHEELKAISRDCITKDHAHHYRGFALNQWKLFQKENPPRVKPLLYILRILLTGVHLMRSGQVEANLVRLNDEARLSYLPELIERKVTGPEQATLQQADWAFYHKEYQRLLDELQQAFQASPLPERPTAEASLNDLLLRVRLRGPSGEPQ